MQALIDFCGKVALGFACLIVIVSVLMFLMLAACTAIGACESVSNPHASEDARAEYQNVTAEISTGTAGFDQAVNNITGG